MGQVVFIEDAIKKIKADGRTIGWLLKQLDISRTHLFFIRNGERALTADNKKKIKAILKQIPK